MIVIEHFQYTLNSQVNFCPELKEEKKKKKEGEKLSRGTDGQVLRSGRFIFLPLKLLTFAMITLWPVHFVHKSSLYFGACCCYRTATVSVTSQVAVACTQLFQWTCYVALTNGTTIASVANTNVKSS